MLLRLLADRVRHLLLRIDSGDSFEIIQQDRDGMADRGAAGQGSFVQVIGITPLDGRASEGASLRWPRLVPLSRQGSGESPLRHLAFSVTHGDPLVRSSP